MAFPLWKAFVLLQTRCGLLAFLCDSSLQNLVVLRQVFFTRLLQVARFVRSTQQVVGPMNSTSAVALVSRGTGSE